MNRYTIYCTEAQAKKAFELGAPIECYTTNIRNEDNLITFETKEVFIRPTAEQMCGWLEEQGLYVFAEPQPYNGGRLWIGNVYNINSPSNYHSYNCLFLQEYSSRQEATLAAIDAALEYLRKNKK